jgi:cell division protein FtsL
MSEGKENKFGTFLKEILTGDIFSKQFFARQIGVIIWGIFLAFIYMNNRMVCEQSYKEIHELRKELATEKHIALFNESELLKASRIGTIKQFIKKQGLNLVEEDIPAYKVIIKQPEKDE